MPDQGFLERVKWEDEKEQLVKDILGAMDGKKAHNCFWIILSIFEIHI